MKWSFTLGFFLALLLSGMSLRAQVSCEYTLELIDTWGDGWNGAALTISINGVPTVYTLNNINDDGSFNSFNITISDGDQVVFAYTPGIFENEVIYNFIDPDGIIVFQAGPNPPVGSSVFSAVLNCPTCPVAPPSSVSVDDVRAFRATVSWTPSDPDGVYLIEYDTAGFTPGTGNVFPGTGSSAVLNDLQQHTAYEFYLSVACANGDTSTTIGPYSFMTLWAIDVGVIAVLTPQSQCGLTAMDTIEVILQNFGGTPQSLVPFNFSVNDVPGGVNQPLDGYFTGVLGTDSIFTIPFETTFDFSQPGEYVIKAWTDLAGDSDSSNDTTTIVIVNIPIVDEYPYFTNFEDWNGGWSVADYSLNSSWQFGQPAGIMINSAASGEYAWVTNLEGNYNNGELSYLISPCFDFSSLTEDPRISFSLYFDSEACCDEGWVESSIDGGETWTKVGAAGTGFNWYNDVSNNWWDGAAGFTGWVTAFNTLAGTAGEDDVRIRFVFSTDFSVVREGMGIDDIFISPPLADDLAALAVNHTSLLECGDEFDQVTMTITNLGTAPQTEFDVAYQINGGVPVIENVGALTIQPGQQGFYTFVTPFDSSDPDEYEILGWTSLSNELFPANDTARFEFATARSIPFAEDFEGGVLPIGWTTDDGFVNNGHSNTSFVISDNIWSFDQSFFVVTPAVGLVEEGDSLTFDYRYVNFSGNGIIPTVLGAGDSLQILISADCGVNYQPVFTIKNANHTPTNQMTNISLPLDDFAGNAIKVRFSAVWSEGDYWLDLDNINVKRCPASLDLTAEVFGASGEDIADGRATITAGAGLAPYTFLWSDGQTGATVSGLLPGVYTVTVADAVGCSDVIEVIVDIMVATEDLPGRISAVSLAPNPTSGVTTLSVQFAKPVDARIQLISLTGQILFETFSNNVSQADYQIDLGSYPDGLYFIRIIVGNEVKTLKLIRAGM
jgi:hypothetical protein